MKAELVSVGTELLLGEIVNTNAQFLSRELAQLGIDVYRQVTVGDNRGRLKDVLRKGLNRADLIITTGGLGPTTDDVTKECAVEVMGYEMEFHEEILEEILELYESYGIEMPDRNRKQAMFPPEATIVPNEMGTAPGMILPRDDWQGDRSVTIICLPGPTREMTRQWEQTVKPYLKEHTEVDEILFSRVLRVCGMGESTVEESISELVEKQESPTIATYAKSAEVHVRLAAQAPSQRRADELFDPVEEEVRSLLGDHVYGTDDTSLEEVVVKILNERNLSLGVIESCTGGLFSERLTSVPGSEHSFKKAIVAPDATEANASFGITEVSQKNPDTREVMAREWARDLLESGEYDVTLSISDTAFEPADSGKENGRVWMGFAGPGGSRVDSFPLRGDRETRKHRSSQHALTRLRRHILERSIL